MSHHLGYEKGNPAGRGSGNRRNGSYPKTMLTEDGATGPDVPRDRNGTFEPAIVPKEACRAIPTFAFVLGTSRNRRKNVSESHREHLRSRRNCATGPKGETRLNGIDELLVSLYARGMTVRDILSCSTALWSRPI